MATMTLPRPLRLRLVRKPASRIQAEALLATMVRWLARKEIKAEWKRLGRQITHVDATALANAVTAHLVVHRTRLRVEAQLILSGSEEQL
jgi:hypothetical protein